MEKEIAKLQTDVNYIKKDTSDIKESIALFIEQSKQTAVEIEELRGRVRETEHCLLTIQGDFKLQVLEYHKEMEALRRDHKQEMDNIRRDNKQEMDSIKSDNKSIWNVVWKISAILALVISGAKIGVDSIFK